MAAIAWSVRRRYPRAVTEQAEPPEGPATERLTGPDSWVNLRVMAAGKDPDSTIEFTLYSDAQFLGGPLLSAGPISLINNLPAYRRPRMAPALTLRLEEALPPREFDMSRSQHEQWLGMDFGEEHAALLALALGVRVRSGGVSRRFERDADPRGCPTGWANRTPQWQAPEDDRLILPAQFGRGVYLDECLNIFAALKCLDSASTTVCLRAARQYADALWLGDTDPDSGWLLLVSALEAVAVHEALHKVSVVEAVELWKPDLVLLLREAGGDALVQSVSEHLADQVQATKRFLGLIRDFTPPPPEVRPSVFAQVDWVGLKKPCSQVYGYRSDRLHAGKPFPAPLLQDPLPDDEGRNAEKPTGLAHGDGVHVWQQRELPMYLQTFAYLTRGVLLAWLTERSGVHGLLGLGQGGLVEVPDPYLVIPEPSSDSDSDS